MIRSARYGYSKDPPARGRVVDGTKAVRGVDQHRVVVTEGQTLWSTFFPTASRNPTQFHRHEGRQVCHLPRADAHGGDLQHRLRGARGAW